MNDSFCSVVEVAFAFLEDKYGFCLRERGRTAVVYENALVTVSLFYDDQRSFEVSLGLGRKSDPAQPPFTFDEIVRSLDVPSEFWPSGYSARNLADAQRLIEKFAEIMASYGKQLLEGDDIAWNRITEQRRADCVAYAAATSLTQAKRIADAAWVAKDYRKVVEALESVQSSLNRADLAKLAYARRVTASDSR